MAITAGTQFDHYEIIAPLGAGGMGEVYRARDMRLDREVAIKILPANFAHDADRLRRFEQEVRATSALNHPNILTVHDFGMHESSPYLVAELLVGEELRAQLTAGALAPKKAIDYAQQIAAGLSAAHERGVIHRDLKPENLFITNDGRVKILDFGLAKLKPQKLAGGVDSEAPTMRPLTNPGVIMGTVGYMSPEQVRGQETDHRSDIFSFGIILHEMLSGQRTFTGDSLVELMNAILKDEPADLSETNAKISPALDKIVRRCLEKKPEMRFHSAHDLGFALSTLTMASGSRLETATALPALTESLPVSKAGLLGNARLWMTVAAVAVLGLLAALTFAVKSLRQPSSGAQVVRTTIPLPKTATAQTLALSPDGRRLAFSAIDAAGKRQLWLRPLDSFTTQPLPGTEDASFPFWSPDGRHIAFFADNKLKKLDTASGVIETICPAGRGSSGGWNQQGIILFNNGLGTGLWRVNAAGGKPEVVTELDAARGEAAHRNPFFLPDGKHFLFQIGGGGQRDICLGSLNTKEYKRLFSGVAPVWAGGYILYVANRTLLARAFDPARLELQGEPFRVADKVNSSGPNASYAVAANGLLAFIEEKEAETVQLTWRDRNGKRLGGLAPAAPWESFCLSPDERSVALTRGEPSRVSSLWLHDLAQGGTTKFSSDGDHQSAVWSPDGKQFAFSTARGMPPNLFLRQFIGNATEERLQTSPRPSFPTSWSPDGKFLIFQMSEPMTRYDLWMMPMAGERKPEPLLQTKANEMGGKVSPDGNWLAYVSDESGNYEIYVTPFPHPARSWRISTSGGTIPYWRGDGKELYFVAGNKLMGVSVAGGTEFQSGTPQPLFEIEGTNYAPGKDGQRFLVPVVTEKAPAPPINVVLNWTADLKK